MTKEQYEIVIRILKERDRQDIKWGANRRLPDGINGDLMPMAEAAKKLVDIKTGEGQETWVEILFEEFMESSTETDPDRLELELIQVAAVAMAWVEDLTRRRGPRPGHAGQKATVRTKAKPPMPYAGP